VDPVSDPLLKPDQVTELKLNNKVVRTAKYRIFFAFHKQHYHWFHAQVPMADIERIRLNGHAKMA
jgi:hypothetical protein